MFQPFWKGDMLPAWRMCKWCNPSESCKESTDSAADLIKTGKIKDLYWQYDKLGWCGRKTRIYFLCLLILSLGCGGKRELWSHTCMFFLNPFKNGIKSVFTCRFIRTWLLSYHIPLNLKIWSQSLSFVSHKNILWYHVRLVRILGVSSLGAAESDSTKCERIHRKRFSTAETWRYKHQRLALKPAYQLRHGSFFESIDLNASVSFSPQRTYSKQQKRSRCCYCLTRRRSTWRSL